jgi:DNA-binding CsgD family transcriptional regulator
MPRKIIDQAAIDKIIALRARGVSREAVAAQFGIHPRTVNAYIAARKKAEAAK